MTITSDRIGVTTGTILPGEATFDRVLRPTTLDEFVGQEETKEKLDIFITAARKRREALDHTLVYGPPGLGKTTLAYIIANEMRSSIKITSGPVLAHGGELAAVLTNLEPNSVLFIDEIHRMPPVVEEVLYPAMEDFRFDIMIGTGPSARAIRMDLVPFTLVGATTRAGLLSAPFRDRFGIVEHLDYYKTDELTEIVERSAQRLQIDVEPEGRSEIARRSRGTPRIANRLLKRVRDFADVRGDGTVNLDISLQALSMLKVDPRGLDAMDAKILRTIMEKFRGGPVGLESLSAAVGEESGTIEEVIEPFLIQQGFIQRTPRGRVVTETTWKHFGMDAFGSPADSQLDLDGG